MRDLRKFALQYPEAVEAIACKGTALECSAFQARAKTFLFLSDADLRVKLLASLAEAAELATEEPDRYHVGAHGWVKVTLRSDQSPPQGILERWIDESYRLVVARQLVALLPQPGRASLVKRRGLGATAKKSANKTPKKKTKR
ncbi:MAG: MmcQ/YjbR family DNA-binding protein [Gemmataceae bacterium]|nr:MmcQ/YjbR family DNA-binding protein [Gemmataceae bacterium]